MESLPDGPKTETLNEHTQSEEIDVSKEPIRNSTPSSYRPIFWSQGKVSVYYIHLLMELTFGLFLVSWAHNYEDGCIDRGIFYWNYVFVPRHICLYVFALNERI